MGFFKFLKSAKNKEENIRIKESVPSTPGRDEKIMTATSRPSATAPTNIGSEMDEDFPDITLEEADIDKDLINVAKRKHMRINRGQILDEDIKLYCRDLATGNSNNGLVLDISPGGLLMVSKGEYSVGDELLVSCRIGLNFRMKEQIKIRMVKGRKYGAEFINPSENTTIFLTQLYGAVGLGKPRTRNKHI